MDADGDIGALIEALEDAVTAGLLIDKQEWAKRYGVSVDDVDACLDALSVLAGVNDAVEDEVPDVFAGRFQVLQEQGRGGMGQVLKGVDRQTNKFVAIKCPRRKVDPGSAPWRRFETEATAMARLNHRAIVKVLAFGEENGWPYFVMEFYDAVGLDEHMKQRGGYSEKICGGVAFELADALAYAHSHGILHRDVKPQNILVTKSGRVVLTDFGLAKLEDSGQTALTRPGDFMGTLGYVSPEQALGQLDRVDGRTDVYGLGATLWAMLTGKQPFVNFYEQARSKLKDSRGPQLQIRLLEEMRTFLSRSQTFEKLEVGNSQLKAIARRCLDNDPMRRYNSAAELREALRPWRRG